MIDFNILMAAAEEARNNSYAPYSHFCVGAALLTQDQTIYTGCNVENAGYSATNCAERTAIFKAVSEGKRNFKAIAIVGGKQGQGGQFCPPCGVCRQVLAEFCPPDFPIALGNAQCYKVYTLSSLLPLAFTPENL